MDETAITLAEPNKHSQIYFTTDQSPPHVTIHALDVDGSNEISDRGPASTNASAFIPRSVIHSSSELVSSSRKSSDRTQVSSIVSKASICTLAATASLSPTNHDDGILSFSDNGFG